MKWLCRRGIPNIMDHPVRAASVGGLFHSRIVTRQRRPLAEVGPLSSTDWTTPSYSFTLPSVASIPETAIEALCHGNGDTFSLFLRLEHRTDSLRVPKP